jgi:hypothetical protein
MGNVKVATLYLTKVILENGRRSYCYSLQWDKGNVCSPDVSIASIVILYMKCEELKKDGYAIKFDTDEVIL